jgi:hypothetical protein
MTDRNSLDDLESKFAPSHGGVFMARHGGAGPSAARSNKKVCVVATDKRFLVELLYEWSKRSDCYYVKYSVAPRDGMYLGRCFLTSDEAAGRLCREYKGHPKLMVTIQDDDFFNAYRGKESPGRPE